MSEIQTNILPNDFVNCILELCLEPINIKSCNWIYDDKDYYSKFNFKILLDEYINIQSFSNFNKIIKTIYDLLIAKNMRTPKTVFFNIKQTLNKAQIYDLLLVVEQIKKGKVWSIGRNHYTEWWFDSPNVIIFSNKLPEKELIEDNKKWKIWIIENEKLVPFTNNNLKIDI